MIKFDRGKFIREIDSYKKILKGFEKKYLLYIDILMFDILIY